MTKLSIIIKKTLLLTAVFALAACGATGIGGSGFGGLSGNQNGAVEKGARPTNDIGIDSGAASDEGWGSAGLGSFESIGSSLPSAGGSGGDEGFNKTQHSAPMEPIGIPVTIAKLEKPNPKQINVTIEEIVDSAGGASHDGNTTKTSYKMVMSGSAGAVPSPQSNPYVYIYNPSTGEEVYAKVSEDGSFEPVALNYQIKTSLIVAVSDQDVIGEPIVFRAQSPEMYTWRYGNAMGDTLYSASFRPIKVMGGEVSIQYYGKINLPDHVALAGDDEDDDEENDEEGVDPNRLIRLESPRISITHADGRISRVTDQRMIDNEIIFKMNEGFYEKNISDQFKKIETPTLGSIARWDVIRKKANTRGVRTGADSENQYITILTDTRIAVIARSDSAVILSSSLVGLPRSVQSAISTQAPMADIVNLLIQGSNFEHSL